MRGESALGCRSACPGVRVCGEDRSGEGPRFAGSENEEHIKQHRSVPITIAHSPCTHSPCFTGKNNSSAVGRVGDTCTHTTLEPPLVSCNSLLSQLDEHTYKHHVLYRGYTPTQLHTEGLWLLDRSAARQSGSTNWVRVLAVGRRCPD